MQNPDEVKALQARDLEIHGNPDEPTFQDLFNRFQKEGLEGDNIYEAIIGTANKTDKAYNKKFGVRE